MRKPAFYKCENKDPDQLRSNCAADQRLCFRYADSTIPILSKSEFQAFSHLLRLYSPVCVGNPEDRFSHNEAQITQPILSTKRKRKPLRTETTVFDNRKIRISSQTQAVNPQKAYI